MPETKQVFEYGILRLEEDLKPAEFDRLVLYNEKHGNRFFDVGYRKIRFKNYVGVVQVGRKTIEILPKIDGASVSDKARWHDVLVDMLRRCGYLNLESLTESRLHLERGTLFDLYLESFLAETANLVHQGLTKTYRHREANLRVLKGQLKFADNIRRNLVHQELFYTRHQAYDQDNIHNRILKQALHILSSGGWRPGIIGEATRLLLAFDRISDQSFSMEHFSRLSFNRGTERYRRALVLAHLVILSYAPGIKHGNNDILAILFDMNALFERYVYCELRRAAAHDGTSVRGQASRLFWQNEDGMRKTICPDILVENGSVGSRTVLDTKWKIPKDGRPADADLKQMYAYNLQFLAQKSYLVYPAASPQQRIRGSFFIPGNIRLSDDNNCGMLFVNLLGNDGKIDPEFGKNLKTEILHHEPACC